MLNYLIMGLVLFPGRIFWPVCAASLAIGLISPLYGILFYLGILYILGIGVFVIDVSGKPKTKNLFSVSILFSRHEMDVYRMFHWYVTAPIAAQSLADLLQLFWMGSIVVTGISIWQHHYFVAATVAPIFLFIRPLIARLHPQLYLGDAAKAGNEKAADLLSTLNTVVVKIKS